MTSAGATDASADDPTDIIEVAYDFVGNSSSTARRYGDTGAEHLKAIGGRGAQGLILGGDVAGQSSLGKGALQTTGTQDAFVASYDSTGTLEWGAIVGSSGIDSTNAVALDPAGDIVAVGMIGGNALIGLDNAKAFGGADGFVGKWDSAGKLIWGQVFGGPNDDEARSLLVDGTGTLYVAGSFKTSASVGTSTVTSKGGSDVFLAKLAP